VSQVRRLGWPRGVASGAGGFLKDLLRISDI
jgi:hypothetical protein